MPEWIFQIAVSLLSVGALYGAIRADLNNMKRSLDLEREQRVAADERIEEIAQDASTRVSVVEGRLKR